jgi:FkbH-like protein
MVGHSDASTGSGGQGFGSTGPSLADIFIQGSRILKSSPGPEARVQRIAILGDVTTDLLGRAIAYGLAQENMFAVMYQAPFGMMTQEILDQKSAFNRFCPDVTLLAPDWRSMVQDLPLSAQQGDVDAAVAGVVANFRTLWQVLAEQHGCRILQHTLVPPGWRLAGQAERALPAAIPNQVSRLNTLLADAAGGQVHWVELDRMAMLFGTRSFASDRIWHTARLCFDQRFLPEYLAYFRSAWRTACARAKKVLVVDLDHTLWGGVVGDDGVAGLVLGAGTPLGEAYVAWQRYIKALAARGVILAVCSKNDPRIAEAGFQHPAMVLKRDDFAAFVCSWQDKAQGLRHIARDLNVGLDSLVFVDDSAAECELVRSELPEVATVHVGGDPGCFMEIFDDACWFDHACLTTADLTRGEAYAARARAAEESIAVTDIGSYLTGLAMIGSLGRPAADDLDRIAQLEQKTNQFNLTTRRFGPAEIRAYLDNPDALVWALRLGDKFGDHGLVSTLFARRVGNQLHIDSWLMSCRVFGRTAEQFMMRHLVAAEKSRGQAGVIVGTYHPTAKNGVVADLYRQLGFEQDGTTWVRRVLRPTTDLVCYVKDKTVPDHSLSHGDLKLNRQRQSMLADDPL